MPVFVKCDSFNESCPYSCKYAYNFRMNHVFDHSEDYTAIMRGRISDQYPTGYLKLSSCPKHKMIKLIGVQS